MLTDPESPAHLKYVINQGPIWKALQAYGNRVQPSSDDSPRFCCLLLFSPKILSDLCEPHGLYPQAPLSLGFSRQEYWSGLPFPSPRDLPDPEIKPVSLASAGRFFTPSHLGSQLSYTYFPYLQVVNQNSKTRTQYK